MKPTPRETKHIHENYNKVVDHLIKEGYTEDKDGADSIINLPFFIIYFEPALLFALNYLLSLRLND